MMNAPSRVSIFKFSFKKKKSYLLPELVIVPLSGKFVLILCPLEGI